MSSQWYSHITMSVASVTFVNILYKSAALIVGVLVCNWTFIFTAAFNRRTKIGAGFNMNVLYKCTSVD